MLSTQSVQQLRKSNSVAQGSPDISKTSLTFSTWFSSTLNGGCSLYVKVVANNDFDKNEMILFRQPQKLAQLLLVCFLIPRIRRAEQVNILYILCWSTFLFICSVIFLFCHPILLRYHCFVCYFKLFMLSEGPVDSPALLSNHLNSSSNTCSL